MAATAPSSVFVDSGAFIALLFEDDHYHEAALRYYESVPTYTRLITTILVVSETFTWLRYHAPFPNAFKFLDVVAEANQSGVLTLVYPDDEMNIRVLELLRRYTEAKLSYVDASSFVVIRQLGIHDVFTFDAHFQMAKCRVWPVTVSH
jgi:predicted nucleic acid-binding protein